SALDACERYITAKQLWLTDIGKGQSGSMRTLTSDRHKEAGAERAALRCDIDPSGLAALCSESHAHPSNFIFSAFSALLSRWNGREDLTMVASISRNGTTSTFPIRLHFSWDLTFKEFVQQVERLVSLASEQGACAFEVLANDPTTSKSQDSFPCF